RQREGGTQIVWLSRSAEVPYARIPDDPLPARDAQIQFALEAFAGRLDGVTPLMRSRIVDMEPIQGLPKVEIDRGGQRQTLEVDRIIANVGYRPDTELYRELQIHLCYASDGPMKLAASLLA